MELIGQKSLKARMEEGDVLFGTFYKFNSPQMTEMLGLAGFDFLLVDGEHSTYSYSEMQDTVRTANGVGMHAVIRVPSGLPEHVLHACDLGAQGVQVPGLHSPEEAAAVTDEMRFYPVGHRGFGLTTRAAKYGFCDGDAFMKWSNNDLLCVVMVETLDMVSRLDELCRNPEIDVLFVGRAACSAAPFRMWSGPSGGACSTSPTAPTSQCSAPPSNRRPAPFGS